MNSQDITRALIDTTVARAMVEMDADPKRSVRKLCDLGRQSSRGRFQNQIFAVLPTVRRFCARSRKNFPLLFPGLSSSVSTAASRTLTIPRFLHPWSEPV